MITAIPRKTLLYTGVLLGLVLLFVVQETTSPRRNAIPIPEITDEVDQIRIEGRNDGLALYRDGDSWVIGDKGFPANPATIDAILEEVERLEAVDVVTARGSSEEYGLDPASRLTLRLFTGDLEPVALQLGESAASGNAVYGRINGSDEIVLLPVSLNAAVALDPLRYREKTMASISEDEIVAVRIESTDFGTVTVQRKIDEGDAPSTTGSDDEPSSEGEDALEITEGVETDWEASGLGADVDPEEITPAQLNALIRELATVEASDFPEYDEEPDGEADGEADGETGTEQPWEGEPFVTVGVETNGGETVTISLYPPDEDGRVPAQTSTSEYLFYIPEWRARRLVLGLERYFIDLQ